MKPPCFRRAAPQARLAAASLLIAGCSALPLAHAAGYRILLGGRDIAALELSAGTPALQRVEGLDEATRRAVTPVALALGLLSDPAVTAP